MRGIRQEELLVKAVREQIPLGVAVMATGSASFIYIPETGGKGIPCGLLLVRARLLWYRTLISLALRACARARRLFSSLTIQTFSFSDNGIPQNSVSPPQRKRLKKNATVCANGCAVARQELEFFSRREIVNGTAACTISKENERSQLEWRREETNSAQPLEQINFWRSWVCACGFLSGRK